MNYKKLILVGFISAFVAVLTSVLGVAGTIIGSVISSVLYNMLSEALEKPVTQASFSSDFEWDIAYIFPLVVIAFIQLLLIFALLSELGFLPGTFVNVYLSIQDLANNNLYRLLGIALLIISAYPLVLKPDFVKKEHGILLVFVALIFLARGFVDVGNAITNIYDVIFARFDLPIAILAFFIIVFVIIRILMSARKSDGEFKKTTRISNGDKFNSHKVRKVQNSKKSENFNSNNRKIRVKNNKKVNQPDYHKKSDPVNPQKQHNVKFGREIDNEEGSPRINKSSGNIHFESNDLLDDFKK
ncbi:MAG: hypothetical protein IJL02_04520 [Methanobrevibacter sp.]|uniref:hypothetical protein n=1 Tax=Methanobrevibacter sp. TaxID=66852 RepID=UPI0025E27F56|nr:hypothetical protein [Methanobrevibacter sp.]MBQ6099110.1 hypothetical protein [Methanobrevibacter sp.]